MKTINLNIRISEKLKEEFYKTAENNVQVPSMLMRKWIENYIEENKKGRD